MTTEEALAVLYCKSEGWLDQQLVKLAQAVVEQAATKVAVDYEREHRNVHQP